MFFFNVEQTLLRATENSAIASADWIGKGEGNLADLAATEAMRKTINQGSFKARVVIGEGERDSAPMLYIGEKLGALTDNSDISEFDIAVDPLEGTDLCAQGKPNALAVIAASTGGGLLHAPDVYMHKIAIGPTKIPVTLNLLAPLEQNIVAVAQAKGKSIEMLSLYM